MNDKNPKFKKVLQIIFSNIILVMCAMKPKRTGRINITMQEREISDAVWLPVDQFYKVGSKFSTTFLDMYFQAVQNNGLIISRNFKMQYEQCDRHITEHRLPVGACPVEFSTT